MYINRIEDVSFVRRVIQSTIVDLHVEADEVAGAGHGEPLWSAGYLRDNWINKDVHTGLHGWVSRLGDLLISRAAS
jgi:hypothetical protein